MTRGALVLCGGRSRRMGRDKASLSFGREVLLQRVVRLVSQAVHEVIVVARPGQELPLLPAQVRVTHDEVLDQGPLGGLVPGLRTATCDAVYVTACDVPFLEPRFVDLLFERLGEHDVAVAETGGFVHPLAAVYRRSVLPAAERLLDEGRLRPVFLYDVVPTRRVFAEELEKADPGLGSLANLNTPEDYQRALEKDAS